MMRGVMNLMGAAFLVMAGLAWGSPRQAGGAEGAMKRQPVRVHPQGMVELTGSDFGRLGGMNADGQKMQLHLGMPDQPPGRQWQEEQRLPICHATWDQGGIRYTQTVLISEAEEGEVLLVMLAGENRAPVYTNAQASLALTVAGRYLDLELKDGILRAVRGGGKPSVPLGMIEVDASAVRTNSGTHLKFHGDMPPGTSGSMIIKIPSQPPLGEEAVNRLYDLDYDLAMLGAKRLWKERLAAGQTNGWPAVVHTDH